VVREDKLLGVFEIFSPRPNAFSDREIQTLQALSRSIVNNVDRAADVVAPPAPVLPSPSMQAAAAATVAEVEGIDHLQLDAVQLIPGPVAIGHEDVPVPVIDSLPVTAPESQRRPRDYSMGVLTLAVITLALFLGWMLGYVRSPGAKAKTSKNVAAQPAQAKPAEDASSSGTAAARVTDQPTPTSPASAPTVPPQGASEQNGAGTLPPGGLVVYENGKVIYRTTPQGAVHTAKASTGPVTVPSKVADEYLMLRVEPDYPESAREQHIQGPVVLDAVVDKDGAVEKLSTVSGDPQLAAAATDAVKQWRFKPFFRNGSPEEFQTQITVSFRLP
jgi:TonB family protein